MARPALMRSDRPRGTTQRRVPSSRRRNGNVEDSDDEDENAVYIVNKLSFFHHGSGVIPTLCPIGNDCWVHKYGSNSNELMTRDGSVIRSVNFKFLANHFASTGKGEILVSDFYNMKLKLISTSGEIYDFADTEPLHPYGLCLTLDDEFLVCLVDNDTCTITSDSQRCIVRMQRDGSIVQRIDFKSQTDEKLFTKPYRISENRNSDLLIIDWTSDKTSRLIVVCKSGKFKTVCKGRQRKFGERSFNPSDVSCNMDSNVIVSDMTSHDIQLLNSEYEFVQLILTAKDSVEYPLAVSIRNDIVWIGSGNGKVFVIQLKKKAKKAIENGNIDHKSKSSICTIT